MFTVPQRKFLLVVAVNILTFTALWDGVLPPETAGQIIIWVNGMYFGVNVAQKIGSK